MVSGHRKSSLQLPPGKSFLCSSGGVVNGDCLALEPLLESFAVFADVMEQAGQTGLFLCPEGGSKVLGQGSCALQMFQDGLGASFVLSLMGEKAGLGPG